MKRVNFIIRYIGTSFALFALAAARISINYYSLIYYQPEVPEKVKALVNAKK